MNRSLPVLLLSVLLVLSGCSFFGGAASPTTTGTPPTGTISEGTAAGTTTPQGTRTPEPFPPGYGESGVVDADRAIEVHASAVLDRESFIVEFNGTALTNDSIATINSLQTSNLSTERAYTITRVGGRGTRVQYFENDTVYVRTNSPDEEGHQYSSREQAFRPREFTGARTVSPLIRHVEYGQPERLPRRGGTFFRYRSSNVTNVQAILGSDVSPENVTDIEVGLVVGPSGIVHRFAYQATVERGNETLQIAIEVNILGFRSTTVDRPDWFDEARSS